MLAEISFDCPSCGTKLSIPVQCLTCGLNPEILFQIRQAARFLALKSARHAAEGLWQHAYEAANESLLLQRQGNDLASFVILISVLAGAKGSIEAIPIPNVERLPKELRNIAAQLIDSIAQIQAVTYPIDDKTDIESIVSALNDSGLSGAPLFFRNDFAGDLSCSRWLNAKYTITISLAVIMIVAAFMFGSHTANRRDSRYEANTDLSISSHEVMPMANAMQHANAVSDSLATIIKLQQYFMADQYNEFINTVLSIYNEADNGYWRSIMPANWWGKTYRRGYRAHEAGDYCTAVEYLSLSLESPEIYYYTDDALLLLARYFRRNGDAESAIHAYRTLINNHQNTESTSYIEEANAYLTSMTN